MLNCDRNEGVANNCLILNSYHKHPCKRMEVQVDMEAGSADRGQKSCRGFFFYGTRVDANFRVFFSPIH